MCAARKIRRLPSLRRDGRQLDNTYIRGGACDRHVLSRSGECYVYAGLIRPPVQIECAALGLEVIRALRQYVKPESAVVRGVHGGVTATVTIPRSVTGAVTPTLVFVSVMVIGSVEPSALGICPIHVTRRS